MPWMGGGDDGVEVLMGSDEGCHAGGVMALFADGSVHFLHIDSLPLDTSDQTPIPRAVGAIILAPAATLPLLLHLAWQAAGSRRSPVEAVA